MSTRCDAGLMIKGEFFACDLEPDHFGLAHTSRSAEAIWKPIPELPLHRMAPYAAWDQYVSDEDIENIIRGRE